MYEEDEAQIGKGKRTAERDEDAEGEGLNTCIGKKDADELREDDG
jgi:hypothetical protein